MKELEVVGKNVDQAIKNGLLQLGKSREDVDIKILETGGLFKKAKVVLIYEEENHDEEVATLPLFDSEPVETAVESEKVQENETTPVETKEVTEQTVEQTVEENEISTKEEKQPKIVDCSRLKSGVVEFLNQLMQQFEVDGKVEVEEGKNELKFKILGENIGKLIGYRGETLNAIQYLLGGLKVAGEGKIRLYLDIEGYKEKRAQTLIDLANKMADKAEEIERNVHLDPMTPYERRIVHTTLQNRTLVETESTGEGIKRHVVIKFKR